MTNGNREALFKRIHTEQGWMELQDIFNAGWDCAMSVCADGGKDSSEARDMADFIAEDGLSEQFRIWRECRDAAISARKK